MPTTIEITSNAIRLCRENRGKLVGIETYPVAAGTDPLDAIGTAPLPKGLGRVVVVMHHPDLLLRTMVQPPCPPERLDRIVRFELESGRGDDAEPVAVSWHLIRCGGGGDMRVLALVAKQSFLARLKKALAVHDGRLGGLVHPGIGLFHAWKRQHGESAEDAAIIDVGGQSVHIVLIKDGELLMLRTQGPGMAQLAKQIAEAQGTPEPEAEKLMQKLGAGSPASLHELINRSAQAVAGLVANNVRFAKAQLQLDHYEPKVTYVAGAGAQVHGFMAALASRAGMPTRMLNPFAGILFSVPVADLDRHAALPSPWTPALGAMLTEHHELDALADERARRAVFWRTDGALRVACAAALALAVLAGARKQLALSTTAAAVADLSGENGGGLVPKAEKAAQEIAALGDAMAGDREAVAFLDGERRAGRIAIELLTAISEQQNGETCPVVLRDYRITRSGQAVVVDLEGFAETAPQKTTADVLRAFERQLVRAYGPIASLIELPKPFTREHQEFAYKLVLPDQPARVLEQSDYATAKGKGLKVKIAVDGACDPRGAAQVVLDRALEAQTEARISIVSPEGKAVGEFAWNERSGLDRAK
jgi:hypothetical protein